jgi:hypothetical protein
MRPEYAALLERLQPINLDLVRQRLTGVVGVNPGDRMRFSLELLHDLVEITERSDPQWHTIDVVLREVRVIGGVKVLVLDRANWPDTATTIRRMRASIMDGATV